MKMMNPCNIPLDQIPKGWRLLTEEEYAQPVKNGMKFRDDRQVTWLTSSHWVNEKRPSKCYTYITEEPARPARPSRWPHWDKWICQSKETASTSSPYL